MPRPILAVGFALLASCGSGSGGSHYYRVVYGALPGSFGVTLPDSCYQADSVAPATTPEQQFAENFCHVGKKPSQTSTQDNFVIEEAWHLFDAGDGKSYLVRHQSGSGPSVGIEGSIQNGKFGFSGDQVFHQPYCSSGYFYGGFVAVCGAKCVNLFSDPANCGRCGGACLPEQMCQSGQCVTSCPTFLQTCGNGSVDLYSDAHNCGSCGVACAAGQTCSFGHCGAPCVAACSVGYDANSCGSPLQFSTTSTSASQFQLNGSRLSGTIGQTTAYACQSANCATDFAQRCPSCVLSAPVSGYEISVQEFDLLQSSAHDNPVTRK